MLNENISAKIEKLIFEDEFSGNILLGKDNEITFTRASGLASKSYNIPNNIETKFNIASIGKIFTGVAVAQLTQNNLISLEDTLCNYIDSTIIDVKISSKIKLKHLLTHTSGLGDYFPLAYAKTYQSEFRDLSDYAELLKDSELLFSPGSQWSYSNSGFVLLGFVIEKVSKMRFYNYVEQNIFIPADMTNSSYCCEDEVESNRAVGYSRVNQCDGSYTYRSNLRKPVIKGSPSGGCYSTVVDIFKFARALLDGKLLNEKFVQEVLSPKPELSSLDYGYGFFVNEKTFGHSGDGTGISTVFKHYKDTDITLVILSNYSNPSATTAFELINSELY